MKKQRIFALVLVLLCNMFITGHAAHDRLVIEDVIAAPGEVVYLTLYLNDTVSGDGMSVTFDYDEAYLELLVDSCSWSRDGIVQDFDEEINVGVWAGGGKTEITGEICVLAFRVITDRQYFNTVVSCTLDIRDGTADACTVGAQARVYTECDHQFGQWNDKGNVGHKRVCGQCELAVTAIHHWKRAATDADPDQPGMAITRFVCEECGAERTHTHAEDQQPTFPVDMEPTRPSEPQENGNGNHTAPTKPAGNEEDDHAGHNHGTSLVDAQWFGVLAIVAVMAALIGVAVFYVKKKR